jgi:glycosyltransferase involved in cell wall biosynthesis
MEQIDKKNGSPITFVVFTYNEERRIEWAIQNFRDWGRILIVDNFSEDRTVEIAKANGCDVLLNKNPGWVEDSETVSRVKAAVQTDWIYWAYADELVGRATLSAIMDAVQSEKFSIVNIIRKNYYYGKFCHDAYSHRMNRVFVRQAIDFSTNTIHNFGEVTVSEDRICYLDAKRHYVRHFTSTDASTWLRSMDKYTDIQSGSYGGSFDRIALGLRLIKTLVGNYLIRGGYKAGFAGFCVAIEMTYYECLLVMKAYERRHGLNAKEIEVLNNAERRKLMA